MRIVIVGLGEVGAYLAKILSSQADYEVVGIDNDRKRLEVLEDLYDIQVVEGYGAAPQVLRRAEVDTADVFLAVSGNDELNIVAALVVRSFSSAFTIARVSNPLYLEEQQLEDYEALGINMLVSPERRTAVTLYQTLEYPQFLKVNTLANGKVHINQFRISEKSPFAYKKIKDIPFTKDLLIVGITRKRDFLFPTGSTEILPNDTLFIAGKQETMRDTRSILPLERKNIRRIILLGASEISYFLAKMIEKKYRVLVIEPSDERSDWIAQMLKHTAIYHDDIFTSNLLDELLLDHDDYFIAATDNDEFNLLSSILVKEKGVSMVACIIQRSYLLSTVEQAGIHQVFSPQMIIANDIAGAIRSRGLLTLQDFQNLEAEFVEFDIQIDAPVANKAIRQLSLPPQTLFIALLRNNNVLITRGDTIIQAQDKVIVLCLKSNFHKLIELFQPEQ
ncbi:MAG: Trk system potassium transporter TrkA [Candidatus Vecturithrix sp.]|jgi:trk system potassium uptake protein TrkA|nr:Trk system potassium transporter TrkA [Candidatus Vecturithrix sp.]